MKRSEMAINDERNGHLVKCSVFLALPKLNEREIARLERIWQMPGSVED